MVDRILLVHCDPQCRCWYVLSFHNQWYRQKNSGTNWLLGCSRLHSSTTFFTHLNSRSLQDLDTADVLLCLLIVLPLGNRQYTSWSNLSSSAPLSSASPSNSGSCGLCVIEATGGIQLVYWAPEDAGNQTSASSPQNPVHVQVEDGFTL